MHITSVNNPTVKAVTKLHQKKYRNESGQFLVEGYHLYEEAQKAGIVRQVFTTDESIQGDHVVHVSDHVLEKLAQVKQPQGVLAVCQKPSTEQVTERVLLLDRIQDPGNLGTLLRSALAFGFTTVVLEDTVDVYNDKVLRSTQGAIFSLHLYEQSIQSFMASHPEYQYIGTAMTGTELDDASPLDPIGLILGNEGSGVAAELLVSTAFNVTIPMQGTESLNVGVAGGILMYHFRKK